MAQSIEKKVLNRISDKIEDGYLPQAIFLTLEIVTL